MSNTPSLTISQAEAAIRKHLPGHDRSTITRLTPIHTTRFSYTPNIKSYIIDIAKPDTPSPPPPCSSFLTIAPPPSTTYPLSLSVVFNLLTTIRTRTQIPIPRQILDTSLSLLPYHLLLTPAAPIASTAIVPLSTARLSEKDKILIEMHTGKLLAQLHTGVQNDWFGVPTQDVPPAEPSYSWQESFTALFEDALSSFEALAERQIPYTQIRTYLSRAIAASLFDDVDTPSLVWFTGSEDDIYIATSRDVGMPHAKDSTPVIAAILPSLFHAVWGDPLMESFFIALDGVSPPSSPFSISSTSPSTSTTSPSSTFTIPTTPTPTNALLEAYTLSTGHPLLSFPRQRTKRVWYTLYLALVVWRGVGVGVDVGVGVGGEGGVPGRGQGDIPGRGQGDIPGRGQGSIPGQGGNGGDVGVEHNAHDQDHARKRAQWCLDTVKKCLLALRDAPNF